MRAWLAGDTDAGDEPAAFVWQQVQCTAVAAHDAFDDGQPESRTADVAARRFQSGEGQLEALDFFGRDAGAAVADVDADFAVVRNEGEL